MKTVKSNLKVTSNNKLMWDDEELVDQRDYRLNGKKMDRKRPVQNWKKAWSEHIEDFDEVDEFYEYR
jgi:hypothetical protein